MVAELAKSFDSHRESPKVLATSATDVTLILRWDRELGGICSRFGAVLPMFYDWTQSKFQLGPSYYSLGALYDF